MDSGSGPMAGGLVLQEAGEGPRMSSQGSFGDSGLEVLEGPHFIIGTGRDNTNQRRLLS